VMARDPRKNQIHKHSQLSTPHQMSSFLTVRFTRSIITTKETSWLTMVGTLLRTWVKSSPWWEWWIESPPIFDMQWMVAKASKAKRIPRQGLPVWGLGVEVRTGPDLVTEPAWSIFKCPLDSHYRVKICLVSPQVGMIAEPRGLFENWEHRGDTSEWHLSVSLVNPVARENDLSVISLWRWIPWDWSWVREHWCIRRQQNRHKR